MARPVDPRSLQRLQGRAGNAAVARLVAQRATAGRGGPPAVQRLAGGSDGAALPVAPTGRTPDRDPRFRSAVADIGAKKRALAQHPPAAAEAKAARDAATGPADDKEAQGKAAQVDRMGTAKPAGFDKAAFIAAVNQAVAAQSPKNLDEADGFATSGKADTIKNQVLGQVAGGKQKSVQDVAEKAAETPDTSKAVDKPVTPLPPRPASPVPAGPDPAAAAIAPAPAEQTDLSTTPQQTDAKMAEANVTKEQLAESNESQFKQALDAKQAADAHAATAPGAFRAVEQQKVAAEKAGAAALGTTGMQGLAAAKTASGGQVTGHQSAAKAQEEAARAKVAAELKGVYDATKAEVDKTLADLDGQVATAFEKGEAGAKAAFTADHQARMQRYKDQRYAGLDGAAQWVVDKFKGLPPEANELFQLSRKLYESRMQEVISGIADLVAEKLGAAKARIARGRDEIAQVVARQPKELQQFAADSAKEIGGRFDELNAAVDEKSKSLVDDLAQRYVAARNAVDEEIKALQAENKGLLDAAMDALTETVATVKKLADMIAGVAARAAGAIDKIIAKPIEFLGNLVNAVKAGVLGFAARAGEHLKQGLKSWLFGQLAAGGIEIPETFDAKGIIRLILSILGLTWANIRARIVRVIPEPAMKALETSFEIVKILVTEGVGGLWRWIVQKMADIKDTVIGAIKDFVLEKIVTAGITWIVSLLNPASAFVRACKAIYDVIMFFVNRAAQIKSFVDSVLDSIEGIASGGGGGVPALIENSLAKAIPVVLDFLASLLGLGGISEKIKSILAKIQAPVTKAVDWLIGKIVAAGKKLLTRLRGKKEGGADSPHSAEVKGRALNDAAVALQGKSRIADSGPALRAVLDRYRPMGLKSLTATASADLSSISIRAVASPPDTRIVRWAEAFPGDDMEKMKLIFQKKDPDGRQRYVVSAISVDGRLVGQHQFNVPGSAADARDGHAERVMLRTHWADALAQVRAAVARGERPRLVFAISASPCPTCTAALRGAITSVREDPTIGGRANFVLAPTTVYEGKPSEGATSLAGNKDKSTGTGLASLVDLGSLGLGWDLMQLATKEKLHPHWELPLAEWAHKLATRFNNSVNGS